MLPLPFLDGICKVTLKWTDGSGRFGSRFFLAGGGGPFALADLNYLASQISTLWGTNLKSQVHNSISLVEVDCLDLGSSTGLTGLWQGNVAGTAGINPMPSNASVDIRAIITNHYRGGHPVLHHPPASQSQLAGPRAWTGAFATATGTAWQTFITGITAITGHTTVNGMPQVVLLKYHPGATAGSVIRATPASYQVNTRVGTMRKRLTT